MSNHSALKTESFAHHSESRMAGLTGASKAAETLSDADIMNLLAHVVEGEIIPRLMLAHQNFVSSEIRAAIDSALSPDAIDQFAKMAIFQEIDDLEDHVVKLTRQGLITETVYLELLAPTARRLGVFWEEDLCSFTDVTIGLGRLQTLLYRLSARDKGNCDQDALVPKGLFVTPFGGQHNFGIRMVEDLFRRAGWQTLCEPNILTHDLIGMLQSETFDLVGIGVSIQSQLELVEEMIKEVRRSSRNSSVKIMIGGSLIVEQPELVASLGADLSAVDAREAVTIAQNIIYDHKMRH